MTSLAAIVEVAKLAQATGAALAGALGFTLAFSLLIRGAARSAEHRRAGRMVAAAGNGALAAVGLVVCLAAVAAALVIMSAK